MIEIDTTTMKSDVEGAILLSEFANSAVAAAQQVRNIWQQILDDSRQNRLDLSAETNDAKIHVFAERLEQTLEDNLRHAVSDQLRSLILDARVAGLILEECKEEEQILKKFSDRG